MIECNHIRRREKSEMKTEPVRIMTVRVPAGLHKWLKRESRQKKVSANALIADALTLMKANETKVGKE